MRDMEVISLEMFTCMIYQLSITVWYWAGVLFSYLIIDYT